MFGRHPCLVGDIVLDINTDEVYKNEYIREVRQSLQTAYLKCKEAILKSNNKRKCYHDNNLPIIRKLELEVIVVTWKVIAKSKIDDRWNGEPYEVVQIPDSDIPFYQVKHIETGLWGYLLTMLNGYQNFHLKSNP